MSLKKLELMGLQKMLMKSTSSKAIIIRINLVFLAFFLVIYAALLLRPSSSVFYDNAASLVRCSLRECPHHQKVEKGVKMKAILEERKAQGVKLIKREKPSFMDEFLGNRGMKIGVINMEEEDLSEWETQKETTTILIPIEFEHVSELFEWKDLFPEWIDEEEEIDGPMCPEIPMPDFNRYGEMDMVVAKVACNNSTSRQVLRLQVHLIAANLAARKGRRDYWNTNRRKKAMKVVFLSECRPMLELFRCKDLVRREGDWWLFEPEMGRLELKLSLPVGSCKLALPLWDKGVDNVYDLSTLKTNTNTPKRQAFVTVLHSTESYVCGAITLAQSLLATGTKFDLILLLDKSISIPKRDALARAGWTLRFIKRIRNPRAEKGTYNEYNYSKFRLWQLTDYDKIIFIDSDIIVLRNLDLLFYFPQMSAAGNDGSIFNSGLMVIEPSNCTFQLLIDRRKEIVSYNGGDQGFLNEVFVWWHRLPRRVNFLKNLWSNYSGEVNLKNHLYGSDPPELYAVHYLGLKPWLCYRDYDCNWDIQDQHVYASDVAHQRWWKVHDAMDEGLQKLCGLAPQRKIDLEWDRMLARKKGLIGDRWMINITDPRRFV